MRMLTGVLFLVVATAAVTACSSSKSTKGGTGGSGTGGSGTAGSGGSGTAGSGGSGTAGSGGSGTAGSGGSGTGGSGGAQCAITPTATVTGTMLGTTLTPQDAEVVKAGSDNFLIITDFAGLCTLGNANKANSNALVFDFYGNAIAPGTVQVGSNLDIQYAYYDQTCNSSKGESATTGSVTFTSVNSCGATGTFTADMANDHITGSFMTGRCADQPGDAGAPACK